MLKILRRAGADSTKILRWVDGCDPGHMRSPDAVNGMNVLFVGFFGGKAGSAVELYQRRPEEPMPHHTSIRVEFSRETVGLPYAIEAVDVKD
jgi:hypothetical protein